MTKFYQNLSKDYENAPKHESMRSEVNRERPGWGANYYYRNDWRSYNWINKFLEYCSSKQFSKVYSKVCNKFRKSKNIKYRDIFKSYIDSHYMNVTHNDYYLDDNNIIRKYESYKKHTIGNKTSQKDSQEYSKQYYEYLDYIKKRNREFKRSLKLINEQIFREAILKSVN